MNVSHNTRFFKQWRSLFFVVTFTTKTTKHHYMAANVVMFITKIVVTVTTQSIVAVTFTAFSSDILALLCFYHA